GVKMNKLSHIQIKRRYQTRRVKTAICARLESNQNHSRVAKPDRRSIIGPETARRSVARPLGTINEAPGGLAVLLPHDVLDVGVHVVSFQERRRWVIAQAVWGVESVAWRGSGSAGRAALAGAGRTRLPEATVVREVTEKRVPEVCR